MEDRREEKRVEANLLTLVISFCPIVNTILAIYLCIRIQIIKNLLKSYLMTDSETLKDISKQIADLLVKQSEIQDTILKAELSKNRYRYCDYGEDMYWYKIISVNECNCTVLELHLRESNEFGSISYCEESLTLSNRGDIITEQEFIDKYNEFINKIKL